MTLSFGAHRQKSSRLSTTLPSLSFQEEAPGVKKTTKEERREGEKKKDKKTTHRSLGSFFVCLGFE